MKRVLAFSLEREEGEGRYVKSFEIFKSNTKEIMRCKCMKAVTLYEACAGAFQRRVPL